MDDHASGLPIAINNIDDFQLQRLAIQGDALLALGKQHRFAINQVQLGVGSRLLRGSSLLRRSRRRSALDGRTGGGELLAAGDDSLELCTGAECGDIGRLYPNGLAGTGITRDASCTTTLLENAESGNGDAFAAVDCAHDGVDDVLDSLCGAPPVRPQLLGQGVDQLCLVHGFPPQYCGPSSDRLLQR